MSKSSKWTSLVFFIISILLCSCSHESQDFSELFDESSTEIQPFSIGRETVNKSTTKILSENPIEFIYENGDNYSYFEISGLADKKVENDLNRQIMDLFIELEKFALMDEPLPYPGIIKRLNNKTSLVATYYAVEPSYNYNNVLSVSGRVFFEFSSKSNADNLIHRTSMTFDLNTGKAIALSQLFRDGIDWITPVNTEVKNYLATSKAEEDSLETTYFHPTQIALTKAFTGIEDTFDFYLSPYEIHLLFDHNASEFYTANGTAVIPINLFEFKDLLALTERFQSQASLFEESITKKIFFAPGFRQAKSESSFEKIGETNWHYNTYTGTENPAIEQITEGIYQEKKLEIQSMIADEPSYNQVTVFTSLSEVGPFYIYGFNYNLNHSSKNYWADYAYVFSQEGLELNVMDLFMDHFDFETYLKQGILSTAKSYDLILSPQELDLLFRSLTFQIHSQDLYFATTPVELSPNSYAPLMLNYAFSDIGIENLQIFQ